MKKKSEKRTRLAERLAVSIITTVILAICLTITSVATVYTCVTLQNNLFVTGRVEINLNDGKAVINRHEFLFEPGMTVNKTFFLENLSTGDVYYKLYFEDVSGGLADVLDVSIASKGVELFKGSVSELTKKNVGAADDILRLKEKRTFAISFHFPEERGNEAQGKELFFTLRADAVQTKNNPNRLFE